MQRDKLLILLTFLAGCGAGAPTGEDPEGFLNPIGIGHFYSWLSPPANLAQSFNPQDCNNHIPAPWGAWGGTQGCAAALQNGQVLLDWTWGKTTPPAYAVDAGTPDGYHLYAALAGNPPVKWDEQTTSYEWTTKAVAPGPQGVQTCFTVRAYKGTLESAGSNPICMTGYGGALKTANLSPAAVRSIETNDGDMFYGVEADPAAGQLRVGYHHHFAQTVVGPNDYFHWDWRSGVRFDLSSLAGRPIMSAKLKMHLAYNDIQGPPAGVNSCLNEVGFALQDFMNVPDETKLDNDVQYTLTDQNVTDRTLDVTPMVRAWVQNQRVNNGFALDNSFYGYAENSWNCESTYDQLELDISYF
jgi:hypothetical protein